MNAYNRKPRGIIEPCPKCGMDSGERKETTNIPIRYFVRCASCGYIVAGDSQSSATSKWNKQSRYGIGNVDRSERCVVCGAEIPEGRQVCPKCEEG